MVLYVWWPWLTSKRVARVCQHQPSFLFWSSWSSLFTIKKLKWKVCTTSGTCGRDRVQTLHTRTYSCTWSSSYNRHHLDVISREWRRRPWTSKVFSNLCVSQQLMTRVFVRRFCIRRPDIGNLPVTQCVSVTKKINIFAPVGKTMRWIEKWLPPFWMVSSTPSYITMQSWGDQIKLRAPAVGAKIWCLSLSRFGLPARGLNKCCVMVCGSILMLFSSFFFRKRLPFKMC